MEELKERFLRPGRKVLDIFPIAMFLSVLISLFGTLLSVPLLRFAGLVVTDSSPAYLDFANDYLAFLGIWIVTFLVLAVFPSNHPMLRCFIPTLRKGNTIGLSLLGLFIGFTLNATCVGISILKGDLALSFNLFEPLPLLFLLFAVFIQSGAEEIVDRLYLFQKLRRRYRSPWFAIIVSSATFAVLHLANPGITAVSVIQILLIGVICALFVYYFNALGAAIGIHTAWNYTQSIIFGLPNSGLVSEYSVFKIDAAANGPFFDTVFGVEGSIGAVALYVLVLIALFAYVKVKHVEPYDIWAEREQKLLEEQGISAISAGEPTSSPAAPKGPRHMA